MVTSSTHSSALYAVSLQIDPEFEELADGIHLVAIAESTLANQGLAEGALTIVLTDDSHVSELNSNFRNIDGPTDVLSFPNHDFQPVHSTTSDKLTSSRHDDVPDDVPNKARDDAPAAIQMPSGRSTAGNAPQELILPDELAAEGDAYLGDIIIAVPYTRRQAEALGRTLSQELALLVVHGVLHLLGYDHATEEDEAGMWAIQQEILGAGGS